MTTKDMERKTIKEISYKQLRETMIAMRMTKKEQLMAMLRITLSKIQKENDNDICEVEYYFNEDRTDKLLSLFKNE